ncbi:MAG: hypothetical protein J1E64_00620 [Acetatifactor sp.]|nr:hypothetical protein [Acetatifactor sp.]
MSKIAKILAFLPISAGARGRLYRILHIGHGRIGNNFKIGLGSYIDAPHIELGDNISIGNMVHIKLLDRFILGDDTSIGSSTIICGAYEFNKFAERAFICGKNVGILCSHYFDVVAPITIGDNVTIAGKWSQFYTHSFDLVPNRLDGAISNGNNVYIGAGALINLGVHICDNVVIQGGTCVNKDITESGVYMSNTFMRRGNVNQYNELFANNNSKELSTGVKVFLKDAIEVNE